MLVPILKGLITPQSIAAAPLGTVYLRRVMQGEIKDDVTLVLALHAQMTTATPRTLQFKFTSVVAWGAFDRIDYDDEQNNREVKMSLPTTALNNLADSVSIAEIDLVAAAPSTRPNFWSVPGAGRTLLLQTLVRIAARKKGGGMKYKAVIAYAAHHPTVNNDDPPLRKALLAMGFASIAVTNHPTDGGASYPSPRSYYLLQNIGNTEWPRRVAQAATYNDTLAQKIMPLVAGTGLKYAV
jgi:hypothetical protein